MGILVGNQVGEPARTEGCTVGFLVGDLVGDLVGVLVGDLVGVLAPRATWTIANMVKRRINNLAILNSLLNT